MIKSEEQKKELKKELYRLYWNENLTINQITNKLDLSGTSILRWMVKLNVPRRTKSESKKGRKLSEQTKENMSKTRRKLYDEEKLSPPMSGKHHTEMAKKKISESAKGRVVSKETRKKKREIMKKILKEGKLNTFLKKNTERKGRTFEELYGESRAKEIKDKTSNSLKNHIPWNRGLTKDVDNRLKRMSENAKLAFEKGRIRPMLNKHHSIETRQKISMANKGKKKHPLSEEHRKRLSVALKGVYHWWNIGKKLSDYQKQRLSEANKGGNNGSFKKGQVSWNKGKHLSETTKEKLRLMHLGKRHSKKTVKKILESRKWYGHSEETKRKIGIAQIGKLNHRYGKKLSKKEKEQRRVISKEMWKDIEFQKKMEKVRALKPNGSEKVLIDLFKKYNLPYKYTGDYRFWIEGRNPDFVNVNGEKKVIELFGDFWHNPKKNKMVKPDKTKSGTVRHYRKYGFDCLVIWERELKDTSKVLEKISRFENVI